MQLARYQSIDTGGGGNGPCLFDPLDKNQESHLLRRADRSGAGQQTGQVEQTGGCEESCVTVLHTLQTGSEIGQEAREHAQEWKRRFRKTSFAHNETAGLCSVLPCFLHTTTGV